MSTQTRFTNHAQIQQHDGWRVEFQPEHLGCDECWTLASTSFSEALINRRYGHTTGRVTLQRRAADLTPLEMHGMAASISKSEAAVK